MDDGREERGGDPPAADPNASSSTGNKAASSCEECGEQPWKYRCPGCCRLTCSLPCVQAHKRRTACTGKRPRADPVPLAVFDDNRLVSDYNFLEEAKQAAESAHRIIAGFGRNFGGPGGAQLPRWLFFLRKAAQRRGIRLFFLPKGMARREHNRTQHNHRKDCIYWTLEWKFNSTDVVLTDHEIDEHATLLSLLEKHLSPGPWKDQLTQFRNTELRDLKLFIQKSAKESASPYRQLNVEEPLGTQLRGTLIVEYPTINVFLPSDSYEFEVEKKVNKIAKKEKETGRMTADPLLEGTEFHEEEIEEGEFSPETKIIDLKDLGTSNATNLAAMEVASEYKIDSNVSSSVLSYSICRALQDQQEELNQCSKKSQNRTSGSSKTKSCMEACPLYTEKPREGNSHRGNHAEVGGVAIATIDTKTDPLGSSSISILPSDDGVGGPQQERRERSKHTPGSTPEALKRRCCTKVYPLDAADDQGCLFPEVLDLEFEQEMRDQYPELFGDMDPDDFVNYDLEMMNDSVEAMSALLWGDLEDGEIPKAPSA